MIQLSHVNKSFAGKAVLTNLQLAVASGEIYGLLGANGAGKSTTLNMLLGFLTPDTGTATIHNQPPVTQRHTIGYIPENVHLYPYLSGFENLQYFCKLAGLHYTPQELSQFLLHCGLAATAHNQPTAQYSKGMRQKVGIAIAYAKKATVYLLDEPASGLDPLASNELSVLLTQLASQGACILMASHDIFRVRETCHTIGILKQGVLVKQIPAKEVSSQELESIYINFMQH